MNIERSQRGGAEVVSLSQVSINYADLEQLQAELYAIIDGGCRRLVLDLQSVGMMDSFGVGVIMSSYRRIASKGGVMKLACVQPRVRSTLAISKVDTVIEVHDDVPSACASFGPAKTASGG